MPNAITIISTDNIDFLHSYAQVFCGKQTSSWHGTTVQAVQPRCSTTPANNPGSPMQVGEEQPRHTCNSTRGESTATALTGSNPSRHSECAVLDPSLRLAGRKRVVGMRSPCSSPQKSCRSPIPKIRRRARTGLEGNPRQDIPSPIHIQPNRQHHNAHTHTLTLQSFKLSQTEENAFEELREDLDTYILQKYTHSLTQNTDTNASTQPVVLNIQDYMRVIRPVQSEKSNVVYLQVLDAKSESKDTLMQILFDLHRRFIEGQGKEYLVLTADAKLYEVIQSLKYEYGTELKWLLSFPGDWHLLKNYQNALIKPYFDAGLKQLACVAGYPVAAIQYCSQFKRTHRFLMEVWQALYQVMVERYMYVESSAETHCTGLPLTDIVSRAACQASQCESTTFADKLARLQENIRQSGYHSKFSSFLNTMSSKDTNWKFWVQFVFKDAMAYTGLYPSDSQR